MASYCPHCGAPSPDEARFCMKCGRERLPEPGTADAPAAGPAEAEDASTPHEATVVDDNPAPPASPPAPPAPPTPASPPAPTGPPAAPASPPPPLRTPPPAPTAPSPAGAFLGRTVRGDWAGSVQAALWPLVTLLAVAVACAIPSYGQDDVDVVGFGDRLRLAFAVVLQAVGGSLEFTGQDERDSLGSSSSDPAIEGSASLHLIPLTVTALFIGALVIGARVLRNRQRARAAAVPGAAGTTAGLEAAVRVGVLTAAGVLVLALFGQPEIEDVELSSGPFLAMLGAFVLALAVSAAVLQRDELAHRLATRPGAQAFVRATGTAMRALVIVLALCSVTAYLSLTQIDDLAETADLRDSGVSPYVVALLLLPNLGVAALGLGWGAPLEAEASRDAPAYGGQDETGTFDLSKLGDVLNSGAVVGALALGLVAALVVGVLAARRCAGRGEQILSAGVFFAVYLLLAAFGGLTFETTASEAGFGGRTASSSIEAGVSVPDVLLFGLLWVAGAVVVAPFLVRMAGQGAFVGAPPLPPTASGATAAAYAAATSPTFAAPTVSPTPGSPAASPTPGASPAPPTAPASPALPASPTASAAAPTQTATPTPAATPTPPPAPTPTPPPALAPTPTPAPTPAPTPYAAYPPGPPQPATANSRGRTGIWAATLAGALVIGGGTAAGVLLWQENGDDTSDEAGKNGSPSVSRSDQPRRDPKGTQDPTDPATPDDTTGAGDGGTEGGVDDASVPAGSQRVTDDKGFSFAVPDGWRRQTSDNPTQITYAGPQGPENFQVGVIRNADYTSYENLDNMEVHAKKDPDKSDYRRVRLEANTFQGHDGAVWEYTYTDRADRTIHAINQSYIADDGTEYAIQLSWREEFWSDAEGARTHRTALDAWRLTG
ncbi:zinc-ribbon domain-containing protein [Streptomyces sp. NPDC059063]|uniref:zinc-ribbon domain-containing protein n=1 Tax=unclassified Streptomyces TaxID=2593676 RepID=UPI0036884DED